MLKRESDKLDIPMALQRLFKIVTSAKPHAIWTWLEKVKYQVECHNFWALQCFNYCL